MGLFTKAKDARIRDKYRKFLEMNNAQKALQCLEELVELELKQGYNNRAAAKVGNAYFTGIAGTYFDNYYLEKVRFEPDMEKARFFFEKQLEYYGGRVNISHSNLTFKDNLLIGWFKTFIAETYYDTDNQMYLKYVRDAAVTNQFPMALGMYAQIYGEDYEKFGMEQDIKKAVSLYITGHKNYYSWDMKSKISYYEYCDFYSYDGYSMLKKLEEYAARSELAQFYIIQHASAEKKARLEYELGMKKLAYEHNSFLEREIGGITWIDKKTGLEIENIEEKFKMMEKEIAELENTLASM